jgi:hypothetical protein
MNETIEGNLYLKNSPLVKNNKLIAEFMGEFNVHDTNGHWECNNCGYQWSAMMGDDEVPQIHVDCLPDLLTNTEYHSSWDWLMPVVEKCRRDFDNYNWFDYVLQHEFVMIITSVLSINIESTYSAVVEFIKRYNEKK